MLHPEDAGSKVFHAIGRCFLSVDNRAMTIKDLAEMTLKFGLMCQNVSAASQAITTYIRNHLARCEAQQDHPLLLRHVLSGTSADDDLLPALHSRVGGAPLQRQLNSTDTIPTGRHTNFRRGTIVWYLSKASGVSCPFARVGILLSKYSSAPAFNTKPRNKEKCGEKRKRLITRRTDRQSPSPAPSSSPVDSGYAESPSPSSEEEEDDDDDEQHERPPKVKLTLRLRPSPACSTPNDIIDLSNDTSSSEDEEDVDMEVNPEPFCLPPYPRRSIAVPCYTPVSPPTRTSLQYVFPQPPIECASPPPDSDHEEEGDFDFSSDEEESRGMSVSIKVEDIDEGMGVGTSVKEKNVRDMLEAWEDLDLDRARTFSCPESSSVFVARENEKRGTPEIKVEALEMWEWEFESGWVGAEVEVKKEDCADVLPSRALSQSPPSSSPWSMFPLSPMSPLTPSTTGSCSSTFHSPSLSYSTGVFCASPESSPSRPQWVAHMRKPSLERKNSVLTWQDAELLGPDSVPITELELEWAGRKRFASPAPVSAASPLASIEDAEMADLQQRTEQNQEEEVVVVHTCVPCDPPVSATQVEGIPVYQTTLSNARVLLRRLDTDFVNLTPLLAAFSSSPFPLSASSSLPPSFCPTLHPSTVYVDHPNPSVSGTWAPLIIARQFLSHAHTQSLSNSALRASVDVFLSDELVMRFPSALRDFWRVSKPGRMLGQFGLCFGGGVVRHNHSHACFGSPPPPRRSVFMEKVSPVQSPPTSSSSEPSESHSPLPLPSSRLPTPNSPLASSSDAHRTHHHHEDIWIFCEESNPEPEPESVLPAFDIALAELGPNLGMLNMNMNMNADLRPDNGGAGVGTEPPLTPTEAEMFRVLCVCPEEEEEEEEESLDCEMGPTDPLRADVDVDTDINVDGDGDVDVEVVEEELEPEQRSLKDGRSLRRSKRVADAAARTHAMRRTRGPRHA